MATVTHVNVSHAEICVETVATNGDTVYRGFNTEQDYQGYCATAHADDAIASVYINGRRYSPGLFTSSEVS